MKEAVARECQFLLATHSPILMACPGACIWSFDTLPLAPVAFDDLESVNLLRAFLRDPEAFTRRL